MMYLHYARHHLRPSEWYSMGHGEQIILQAFMQREIEEEKELKEKLES